jgi:hypothetical protein
MGTWAWVLVLGFGLIKIPIGLLMLWVPYRNDASAIPLPAPEDNGSAGEDDGGSKTLPGAPRRPSPNRPHPRTPLRGPHGPRRGPHGAPAPSAPERSRHTVPKRPSRIGA